MFDFAPDHPRIHPEHVHRDRALYALGRETACSATCRLPVSSNHINNFDDEPDLRLYGAAKRTVNVENRTYVGLLRDSSGVLSPEPLLVC